MEKVDISGVRRTNNKRTLINGEYWNGGGPLPLASLVPNDVSLMVLLPLSKISGTMYYCYLLAE